MNYILGIDTSCYTTSIALVNMEGNVVYSKQLLLEVRKGDRGIRQSNAVFKHLHNVPIITGEIKRIINPGNIVAVCGSVKPRPVDGSYMPVFMVSCLMGRAFADILDVPFFEVSHQENHIMAAKYSVKDLNVDRFLAIHLSGGTSELLDVKDTGTGYKISILGATQDLHAGQFVDRIGVAMGMPFPAGPYLEELAKKGRYGRVVIPSYVNGLTIGFSGAETHARRLYERGEDPADIAIGVFACVIKTLEKWIYNATRETGPKNILLAGGVSSSSIIRKKLPERVERRDKNIRLFFADPVLSKDNAVGTALLGLRLYNKGGDYESKNS